MHSRPWNHVQPRHRQVRLRIALWRSRCEWTGLRNVVADCVFSCRAAVIDLSRPPKRSSSSGFAIGCTDQMTAGTKSAVGCGLTQTGPVWACPPSAEAEAFQYPFPDSWVGLMGSFSPVV